MGPNMEYQTKLTLMIYNKDRSNHLRAEGEIVLPFLPSEGMHLQVGNMYPITIVKVIWLTDDKIFHCITEEKMHDYEFDLDTDIDELTDVLDILRDAKLLGWKGCDKIYRDK